MKTTIRIVIAALAIAAPLSAFAQSDASTTRSDVKAQLVQAEAAGYTPGAKDPSYPSQIQAASTRINSSEGGTSDGTFAVGGLYQHAQEPGANNAQMNSVYFGR